jgi:thiol-disulfide isomerase/thioredoxin
MKIINQYSFLWIAVFSLLILAIFLFRDGIKKTDFAILGGVVALIAVIWLLIRPHATPNANSDNVQSQIGMGLPVLLEFQSPYWIACNAIKPIVDGIEKEFQSRLIIIRVNIQDSASRALLAKYNFQFTPTFIFFDAQGIEIWRTIGSLDAQQVRESLPWSGPVDFFSHFGISEIHPGIPTSRHLSWSILWITTRQGVPSIWVAGPGLMSSRWLNIIGGWSVLIMSEKLSALPDEKPARQISRQNFGLGMSPIWIGWLSPLIWFSILVVCIAWTLPADKNTSRI